MKVLAFRVSVLCLILTLGLSQNILLPDDYELTLSDLDCIYESNPNYHVLVPLNIFSGYKFTLNPFFINNSNLLYNYTCNLTCAYNDCKIIDPVISIDLSYTTQLLEIVREINSQVSKIERSACGQYGSNAATFLINSTTQKWSKNTTVNNLFWQMILPNLITSNYILTDQQSYSDVFGAGANLTKKFSDVFCLAQELNATSTCLHQSDNCSFVGLAKNQYFKVYQEKVVVCGIGFTYESNLYNCMSPPNYEIESIVII